MVVEEGKERGSSGGRLFEAKKYGRSTSIARVWTPPALAMARCDEQK